MHLSKIKIKNFRCLSSVELDVKAITVIYGENGSGKSSILEAIQLLKQSIRQSRLVTTETLNFGSFRDIVKDGDETQWVSIGLEISFDKDEFKKLLFFSGIDEFVQHIDKVNLPVNDTEYEISFRETKNELELNQVLKLNGVPLIETRSSFEKGGLQEKLITPDIGAVPNNPREILNDYLGYINFHQLDAEKGKIRELYGRLVQDLVLIFRNVLNDYFVIGPTRATAPFEVETPTDPKWVGHKGENLSGLLSKIWGKVELSKKREKISKWAAVFGLSELWAGFHGGKKLGVTFKDPKIGAPVNLNWAGHGSKQMLVLITQMFYGDKGEIVALEEPEISLHLQLQMELPRLFAEVAKEGKQIIITSHSAQLLTAFRPLFKNHTLATKNLSVYHLEKTQKGTIIEKLKVTEQGTVKPFLPSIAEAEKKLVSEAY